MAVALAPQSLLHLATNVEDVDTDRPALLLDPRQAGSQKYGFVARTGGGKSYAAGKLVELLFGAGVPVIILDPVGNWYGLRIAADGTSPGLDIPVIGGQRGDVPLPLERAEELAKLLVEHDGSAIIDLSELRKGERKNFVTPFAEALFHAAKQHRRTRMIVIEEAQVFAPQQHKGQERMLGAIEDIVRLGRNYGLGSVLISQRPQSVNKEVLNQVECLFVGQLQGSHERKAIREWIFSKGTHGDTTVDHELLGLQPGTFYCWSPQWLRWFGKVQIEPKETFDASATPELGGIEASAVVTKLDLDWLRDLAKPKPKKGKAALDEVLDEIDDDAELQLGKPCENCAALQRKHEHLIGVITNLEGALVRLSQDVARDSAALGAALSGKVDSIRSGLAFLEVESPPAPDDTEPKPAPVRAPRQPEAKARPSPRSMGDLGELMLVVMLNVGACPTRIELAIRCGVSHSGGHYRRSLKALLDGLDVQNTEGQALMLTAPGRTKARTLAAGIRPLSSRELVETWSRRLKGAAPEIMVALLETRLPMTSTRLAERVSMSAVGGHFRRGVKQLRTAGIVVGDPNGWTISPEARCLRK